ncbi:outer membrane beta-barrel protein [Flavisolibacter ginsengisoli]|jgi:hypothetical protein|uniref:Outer membrane receptor proteins, mostly Fe transport n=1 Tax=Flavisolibacter ginsengisoli DSM 18119 TaxID=1121884 RepID=A0A1M5BBP6_9BACT|nr:outer membrane beta-barrel family protein [Flavisolibacter ginsengisoli]SHF39845.1 Outer membrane receptor proteins, mostly Fe transport [Flavisolibacter ginsengisoli DSM 18119]
MKLLIFILFTFTCSAICAQQVSIRGQVLDPVQKGINAANIIISDTSFKPVKGTTSVADGTFNLEKLHPGSYTIAITSVGYNTSSIKVNLQKDTVIHLTLIPSAKSLKEVVVTSSKKLFEMKPDKIVMNVEGNALAVGNSVFDVIRKGPAVSVDKDDNLLMKRGAVAIFINGKQSFLSGTQLTEYLKNLPSETVASIEFITNPGNKYPAEGNSGIINIRLKKNTLFGTNGQASVGLGYGRYPKCRTSLNLNHRSKVLNIFGSSNISYSRSYNELTYNSRITNGTEITYQDRNNYWNPRSLWQSYKAGLDYNISEKTLVGVVLNLDKEKDTVVTTNTSSFSEYRKVLQRRIESVKKQREQLNAWSANINFKRTMDTLGTEWTADVDYSMYNRKEHSLNENAFLDENNLKSRNDFVFFNQQPARVQLIALKSDYSRIISNTAKFEFGFKFSKVNTDNNLVSDTLASRGWEPDLNVSNHFLLDEAITAGYVIYSGKLKEMEYQFGLRSEYTATKGNSKTYGQITKRSYLGLFPTAFVRKKINDNNDLSFSYARRVSRPGYNSLNPFVSYIDPYTRFEGNPQLNAAYSNNFELKHSYKQWLVSSFSYYSVTGNIINTILQDNITKVIVNKSQNAGKSSAFRFDVMASTTWRWWSASTNIGLGYSHGVSTLPGYSYDSKSFTGEFSTNHSFTLPRSIKLMLDGYYSLPEVSGLAHLESSYAVNLGVQKSFCENKVTVRINASSLFGPHQYRAHYLGSGLDIRWVNEWEGRRINLNISYKFGNQKLKDSRKKRDALEDEKGRVNF